MYKDRKTSKMNIVMESDLRHKIVVECVKLLNTVVQSLDQFSEVPHFLFDLSFYYL